MLANAVESNIIMLFLFEYYRFKLANIAFIFMPKSGAQRKMEAWVFRVIKALFTHLDYT